PPPLPGEGRVGPSPPWGEGWVGASIQTGREVAVARVGEDSYDHALFDGRGQLAHRPQRRAAGVSDQQAFAARDGARQVVRGLGLAVPDLIGKSLVPDARHDRRWKVLQTFEAVKRVVRLHSDGVDRRVVLLQAPSDADECAVRAESRDELRDAPARLLEYLDRRAFVMRARVGGVGVLVGIEVHVGVVSYQ